MPLLLGANPTMDELVASLQVWAAQVEGVNAAERLSELTGSIAALPTVKPGTILPFGGASADVPSGYLYCDGSAVSRTTYASLFAAIKTTWGAGNGSTTFNLPDGRGRHFFGKATSGTGSTLGGTFGSIDHTHTGPSHTHSISSAGAHTHAINGDTQTVDLRNHTHSLTNTTVDANLDGVTKSVADGTSTGDAAEAGLNHDHEEGTLATASDGSHDHGGTTGSGGTGSTGTANPPSFVGNWMIKT